MSSFRISDPFSSMIAVFEFPSVSGRFLHLNEHVSLSLFHNLLDLLFDSEPSKNGNIFTICFYKTEIENENWSSSLIFKQD